MIGKQFASNFCPANLSIAYIYKRFVMLTLICMIKLNFNFIEFHFQKMEGLVLLQGFGSSSKSSFQMSNRSISVCIINFTTTSFLICFDFLPLYFLACSGEKDCGLLAYCDSGVCACLEDAFGYASVGCNKSE